MCFADSKDLIKSIIQNEEVFTMYMDNILKLSAPSCIHPNTNANQSSLFAGATVDAANLVNAHKFIENIVNKATNSEQHESSASNSSLGNKKAYFKLLADSADSNMKPNIQSPFSQMNSLMSLFNNPMSIESTLADQFDQQQQSDLFSLPLPPPPPPPPSTTATTTTAFPMQQQKPSKLSNFLIVKFEIMANNESTSKSKSKYKKSIKIHSIQTKVYNGTNHDHHQQPNDPFITQKAYEFTEKCFSFRLACLDLLIDSSKETRVYIKLINLYDKSLIALINFGQKLKFFQVKHEESSSLSLQKQQQQQADATTASTSYVLSATSSSRLNLTELFIDNLGVDVDQTLFGVLNLIPVCVSTLDDDCDVRAMAMLDTSGIVHVIDPFKSTRLSQFALPSNLSDEKFVKITYCNGMLNFLFLLFQTVLKTIE